MTIDHSTEAGPVGASCTDIYLGFRHRCAASLIRDFYPEGMPEDWRHSYLVMMTQAIWINDGDEDRAEMLAAIVDAPKPVLTVWKTDDPTQVNLWRAAHPEQPLIILSSDTPVWSPGVEGADARVALVPGSDQPAQMRAFIEKFARQAPVGPCALFIDGEPPSVPALDRMRTLIELLGL